MADAPSARVPAHYRCPALDMDHWPVSEVPYMGASSGSEEPQGPVPSQALESRPLGTSGRPIDTQLDISLASPIAPIKQCYHILFWMTLISRFALA